MAKPKPNWLLVEGPDDLHWIMPDNRSEGALETFLEYLVPPESQQLWRYAKEAVSSAKIHGATYREAHALKACLHTWLAWQDPPGRQPGLALTRKVLDPDSPSAGAFVSWFRRLYQL